MTRFRGTGASRGIAIAPAHLMDVRVVIAERRILLNDVDAEIARLEAALAAAAGQLDHIQRQVDGEYGGGGHEFIEAHRLILRSPELAGESRRLIAGECFAAEWAVFHAIERIRSIFAHLDDPYFRDRGGDFEVVGERLLRVLLGLPELRPGAGAARGGIVVGTDILLGRERLSAEQQEIALWVSVAMWLEARNRPGIQRPAVIRLVREFLAFQNSGFLPYISHSCGCDLVKAKGRCRVARSGRPLLALARSVLGDFHHTAPPSVRLVARRARFGHGYWDAEEGNA